MDSDTSPGTWSNELIERDTISLEEYLSHYSSRITQDSERLFISEFVYPLLGEENMKYCIPQYPFIDSEGRNRRIDFVVKKGESKIALEVNGETYHAEGIIPTEMFDENLNRQNEILAAGYSLLRFSYTQLQAPHWRERVKEQLRKLVYDNVPEITSSRLIEPHPLQLEVLDALNFYRSKGWKEGVVVLPTGTGKTYLGAFDSQRAPGRILFIVHRLDILAQAKIAFEKIYPEEIIGLLTGEVKEHVEDSKVIFASKDTLRNPAVLSTFPPDAFDYIIIDEVHHGQAPSYKAVLDHFEPGFFKLGLTATPDRLDRKDILELFDYHKVFEYSLNDAIENGFLVPFKYVGLQDNIDYSNIRHNGTKYNVQDLNRLLIIPERNQRILEEYLDKGDGGKAIGFCVSIEHANSMASHFNENGIPSVAITSSVSSEERAESIRKFNDNEVAVAFTVDLFNEGVDFPNVRVLLFLRPTESKTVFIQQLGRGLRLHSGKDQVVVLDFISNYRRANNVRKYLSKASTDRINPETGRVEKTVYEYAPGCTVEFDAEIEQILDRQDSDQRELTKADLIDAYYTLAEKLEHKPSQDEINAEGEFRIARYLDLFGSWSSFLREIGEETEASYHFPQGTHLGHILYIIDRIYKNELEGSNIDPEYIRFRGGVDEGREGIGGFRRQTKYKLQAAMEMGLVVDERKLSLEEEYVPRLTPKGERFYRALRPVIESVDLSVQDRDGDIPSWRMTTNPEDFNVAIKNLLTSHREEHLEVSNILLTMPAAGLMIQYLYRVERRPDIGKSELYETFFDAPFVRQFCDRQGIPYGTPEGRKRRCPFLLNILEALGAVEQSRREVHVRTFINSKQTLQFSSSIDPETIQSWMRGIDEFFETGTHQLSDDETVRLREEFGGNFLTPSYYLNQHLTVPNAQ